MRDIVRASGMSGGALYLYFKSKDELIETIAENRHLRERDWITSALQRDNFAKSLQVLIRSFANSLTDRDALQERRLAIQVWAEALLDPKLRASVLRGVDTPTDLLTAFFQSAQRTGRFSKSLNCRAVARVLVALYQGLVLQVAWEPDVSLKPQLKVIHSMLLAIAATPGETEH